MCQGHCHHVRLHLGSERVPWCGAAQVCNERGLPGRALRAQGPGGEKTVLVRRPHACATNAQVGAVAVVQGGQGGKQMRLLARSRVLHQWHSDLPALFYLGARGLERRMRGIMEHARRWCK
jgi:hypothetical protein